MISAQPSGHEGEPINFDDISEWTWLTQANLIFDEYYFIDYRMQKEEARRLIQNASVIFLCGGDPVQQNDFLAEYELLNVIKDSNAVIMGASAGALNMSAKWLSLDRIARATNLKQVIFTMVLALIILPMKVILNATTPHLLKATCFPCLKRLMFMRQNRRALCV